MVLMASGNASTMSLAGCTLLAVRNRHGLLDWLTSFHFRFDVVLEGFFRFGFDQRHDGSLVWVLDEDAASVDVATEWATGVGNNFKLNVSFLVVGDWAGVRDIQ